MYVCRLQVNICPECEAYTVKELDRDGTSYPREEALRARYMCGSCPKSFDLGITMFDPRGWPGVTLFEGADLFQPPVPPSGRPPCPRCLKNAAVSFQCMTLYLGRIRGCPVNLVVLLRGSTWKRSWRAKKKKKNANPFLSDLV